MVRCTVTVTEIWRLRRQGVLSLWKVRLQGILSVKSEMAGCSVTVESETAGCPVTVENDMAGSCNNVASVVAECFVTVESETAGGLREVILHDSCKHIINACLHHRGIISVPCQLLISIVNIILVNMNTTANSRWHTPLSTHLIKNKSLSHPSKTKAVRGSDEPEHSQLCSH